MRNYDENVYLEPKTLILKHKFRKILLLKNFKLLRTSELYQIFIQHRRILLDLLGRKLAIQRVLKKQEYHHLGGVRRKPYICHTVLNFKNKLAIEYMAKKQQYFHLGRGGGRKLWICPIPLNFENQTPRKLELRN